ncbi:response regulator [Desulfococcaceae bacterium HSG8]|nr:response regulator [Desulfococcaceae bacterium HSG8]
MLKISEREEKMAHILIIDDEKQIRAMLRQMLEFEGYEVTEADDGKKGVRSHSEKPADLIITDIVMPEKEGIETILDIRKISPAVKIIAMSGGGRIEPETYLHMARSFGAMRTFAKPIKMEELLKAVRELLSV